MKIDYIGPKGLCGPRSYMTAEAPIQRPKRRRWSIILAAVIIIALIVGVVAYEVFLAGTPTVTIQGAGATFPAPLIQNWTVTYHNLYSNVTINYNSVGSTAGTKLIQNKTVDFGASDAPLTDAQLAATPGLILFPETLGGVAVTYNVPGIPSTTHLNITGDVLAKVYNGTIINWNDPAIKSLQSPSIASALPDQAISAVHRSDGSGTTYAFKDYLSHVNAWWNKTVTVDTSTSWPAAGPAGSGNAGVAGTVSNTQGAIGYVDVIYAVKNSLGVGAVLNRGGYYTTPTLQGITYAAANETVITSPTDLRQHIVNARGAQSYPIATYTYIMVYKQMSDNPHTSKNVAYSLARFLWWIVGPDGQSRAPGLIYAQLPSNIVSADQALLRTLTWQGQQIITN